MRTLLKSGNSIRNSGRLDITGFDITGFDITGFDCNNIMSNELSG